MAFKKWIIGAPDRVLAKHLAEECDIDPFTAMIASVRGYKEPYELEQLLSSEPLLCDPYELADITVAAERINRAVAEDELIAVFGDYDCDGVTASAIVYDYLVSRAARVVCYIPDRQLEGYGMNCGAVDKLHAQGVSLIVTVDNGISCAKEIAYAASLGIDTVVTDHHLPPKELPQAVAVVDPHRDDCPSSFKEICGAEVAFKLICVLEDKEPEQILHRYADLLCIATVGDVMPLINENRCIVREGVKLIKASPRIGVSALINVAGLDRNNIGAGNVSFGLVPRINAAGRMGAAERAFKLLVSDNMMEALSLANEIDAENSARQQTEQRITAEACELIEKHGYNYDRVIVVSGKDWHSGVIGIAASRITEKYGKPAIVLSEADEVSHGSGRSISGFSLYNAISACSKILQKFGGHELAAGLSIETEKIGDFRRMINDYAEKTDICPPHINIDLRLNPAAMTVDMAEALKELEPFGMGNPTPLFGLFGVKLDKINPIGNGRHLKLLFSRDEAVFQALLFGVTVQQFCFECGDILDLAVVLDTNVYQGICSLSVQIKAVRMSGTDDDALFGSLFAYHDYLSGRNTDNSLLSVTREQVGEVYRLINRAPVSKQRLEYLFLSSLGYGKTMIALDILCELGLVKNENGRVFAVPGVKSNIQNSSIYQKLSLGEGN